MLGDDDGWGRRGFGVYPTLINREGPDVGRAQESGMARGVMWPNGCQTVEFQNHDGSITTYRTHGGMPQVTTNEIVVEVSCVMMPDIKSPLTETNYSLRTFHDETRVWSNNRILSMVVSPTRTINVQSGDIPPKTLRICLGHGSSAASGLPEDLVEIAREQAADWLIKQTSCNLTSGGLKRLFYAYDARWDSITFKRGCATTQFLLIGTTDYPEVHGYVSGVQDHALTETDLGAIRSLSFSRSGSGTLLYVSFLSPYGFIENLKNLMVRQSGNTYEPRRRFSGFSASIKGFHTSTGFYTDTSLSTLVYAVSSGAPRYNPVLPRYYKFVDAADLVYGNYRLPCDAIIQGVDMAPVQPIQLGTTEHLYRDGNGIVWVIVVSWTWGYSAHTHTLKVYVQKRFDKFMENPPAGVTVLAEETFVDEQEWGGSAYHSVGTTIPPYTWLRSLPNGTEAFWVCERRCFIRIQFSGNGTEPTGSGISATLTQVGRMQEYSYETDSGGHDTYTYATQNELLNVYPTATNNWEYLIEEYNLVYNAEWHEIDPGHGYIEHALTSQTRGLRRAGVSVTQVIATEYYSDGGTGWGSDTVVSGTAGVSGLAVFANDEYVLGGQESVMVAGVVTNGAIKYKGTFTRGHLVGFGTDTRLVAINPRDDSVHIAANNASAGVFF